MSNHDVSTFATSLVQMATALENEPRYKAEIESLRRQLDDKSNIVQRLETKLIDRNTQIDNLNAKIRSLEVERDQAQFHSLELEERIERASSAFKALTDLGIQINSDLNPPKPMPEPVKEVPTAPQEGVSANGLLYSSVNTTGAEHTTPATEVTTAAPSSAIASDGTVSPGEGQSETTPIHSASSTSTEPVNAVSSGDTAPMPLQDTPLSGSHSSWAGPASTETAPQPWGQYYGKRYADIPYYVSRADWLAEGGSEEDYDSYYRTPQAVQGS